MLHAEESKRYQVLSELDTEQEIEIDKEFLARADWIEDNFSSHFQIFLAASLVTAPNPKNFELDFLEFYWVYREYRNSLADEVNRPKDFDEIYSIKGEERKIVFEVFKETTRSKKNKKRMTRLIKDFQKKGLIEIVQRHSWHQYTVNVLNPISNH